MEKQHDDRLETSPAQHPRRPVTITTDVGRHFEINDIIEILRAFYATDVMIIMKVHPFKET